MNNARILLSVAAGILCWCGGVLAQTAVPAWTNFYNGPTNSTDVATALALDSNGNVFVTGGSEDGPQVNAHYATVAYSNTGAPLWTNRYVGPVHGSDEPNAVAVDGSGRVFVTGCSSGSSNNLSSDYATVAYSNAGVPLWTNRYNGPGNGDDTARAIAVDGRGNVIVTGESWGTGSYRDLTTLAYSSDGVPLWTNRFNAAANGDDQASAVAVDGSGSVIVTGFTGVQGGSYDYVTIKYSLSVALAIQKMENEAVVSWTNVAFGWTNLGWRLQSASSLAGPFTNIDGATSPYTNPLVGNARFFRLLQE